MSDTSGFHPAGPAWDDGVWNFLAYWFAGLVEGLEAIDAPARETILAACGRACTRSYTGRVFREAWVQSRDLDAFLAVLADRFPGARYERVGPRTVQVRYAACACDLVTLGLVTSGVLCECSAHNLQANFEGALGAPVTVTLEGSIQRGDDCCAFRVTLEPTTRGKGRQEEEKA